MGYYNCGGPQMQDDNFTFPEARRPGDRETVYTVAMGQLDRYFTPQVNIPYERHLFRTRLRDRADYCEFGEATNENIRDQVIDKCLSSRL